MEENNNEKPKKDWTKEVEVAGSELVGKIKELVRQGNIRRLIIKKENGDKLFDIPLTAGVVVTGGLLVLWPIIAAVGAVAGLLAKVKIEIVRTDDKEK
jgi:hypothetical protein